ncbi:MAG: MBL fold metallo-hydrolase [Mycobacteriaceae bacterium]|nr:MBL fold metallo-hydrolase [Mycobacteriaceae bacterium]
MAWAITSVTDSLYFVQGDLVNWAVATGDGRVTLFDSGLPGDRDDVLASLAKIGFGAAEVRAIVLTHAHVDHLGTAIWFANAHGTRVFCHGEEVGHAKREYLEQASPVDVAMHIWRPGWAPWAVRLLRKGGMVHDGVPTAQALTSDVAATLPGQPMAIPTPGHTGGHCSFIVDGVLVSGDALVTGHAVSRRAGPQLLPSVFNHDDAGCRRSLGALGLLDTDVLLPGHGPLWRGPIRQAVEQALT